MSHHRNIALVSVTDPADAAESIATALHGKLAATRFIREMLDHLEPAKPPTLFDSGAA